MVTVTEHVYPSCEVKVTINGENACETLEAVKKYYEDYPYVNYGTTGGKHITKRNEKTYSANINRKGV